MSAASKRFSDTACFTSINAPFALSGASSRIFGHTVPPGLCCSRCAVADIERIVRRRAPSVSAVPNIAIDGARVRWRTDARKACVQHRRRWSRRTVGAARESWLYSFGCDHSGVARSHSDLAAFAQLGLRSERSRRHGAVDRRHPVAVGTTVENSIRKRFYRAAGDRTPPSPLRNIRRYALRARGDRARRCDRGCMKSSRRTEVAPPLR